VHIKSTRASRDSSRKEIRVVLGTKSAQAHQTIVDNIVIDGITLSCEKRSVTTRNFTGELKNSRKPGAYKSRLGTKVCTLMHVLCTRRRIRNVSSGYAKFAILGVVLSLSLFFSLLISAYSR